MKNLLFAVLLTACAATPHVASRESHTWKLNLQFEDQGGGCGLVGKIPYWISIDRTGSLYTFEDAISSELCVGSVGSQTVTVSCSGTRSDLDMEYNFSFKLQAKGELAFGAGEVTITNPYSTCKQPFAATGVVR